MGTITVARSCACDARLEILEFEDRSRVERPVPDRLRDGAEHGDLRVVRRLQHQEKRLWSEVRCHLGTAGELALLDGDVAGRARPGLDVKDERGIDGSQRLRLNRPTSERHRPC